MNYSRQDIKPPATAEQLAEVETQFRMTLPVELAEILRENNGVTLWLEPKEIQILSTREIAKYFEEYGFDRWMTDALPFAMDGAGNFLVLKRNEGEAVYIVSSGNLGWDDAITIAETMNQFLEDAQPPSYYLYGR